MKILLIDIDSKIPNLALKKIEKYHSDKGHEIFWNNELMYYAASKVYISCIFTDNFKKLYEWRDDPKVNIGGSGYSLKVKLPDEIEKINPKINIGFTTRGCIRKCPFCIVPEKEGKLKRENHISDIWDGKSKVVELLDNNWLADKEWFFENSLFAIEHGIKIKENGMDLKLVNEDIAVRLADLRFKNKLHFAWDNMKDEKIITRKLKTLFKWIKASQIMIYILVGFNTTFAEDMYRIKKIKELGCDPFVMLYHRKSKVLNELASWNNRFYFRKITFKQFLESRNYGYLMAGNNAFL